MKLFKTSGEPGDAKVSRPVRRGVVGKGSYARYLAGSLPYHEDTKHRHAHVLWFGDKRMGKKAFLSWQTDVRAELVRLEQQQTNDRAAQQGMELDTGQARARAKGQEVGLGW